MFGKIGFIVSSFDVFVFMLGMYAGIYADQHYQIPRVDDPKELWKKIEELSEKYRKDKSE